MTKTEKQKKTKKTKNTTVNLSIQYFTGKSTIAVGGNNKDDSKEAQDLKLTYNTIFKDELTNFGKTCKSLEDEMAKGYRATESAADAIREAISNYDTIEAKEKCEPGRMLAASVKVTNTTGALVSAAASEDNKNIATHANDVRKAVEDVLESTKGACIENPCGEAIIISAGNGAKNLGATTLDLLESGIYTN